MRFIFIFISINFSNGRREAFLWTANDCDVAIVHTHTYNVCAPIQGCKQWSSKEEACYNLANYNGWRDFLVTKWLTTMRSKFAPEFSVNQPRLITMQFAFTVAFLFHRSFLVGLCLAFHHKSWDIRKCVFIIRCVFHLLFSLSTSRLFSLLSSFSDSFECIHPCVVNGFRSEIELERKRIKSFHSFGERSNFNKGPTIIHNHMYCECGRRCHHLLFESIILIII